MTVIAARGKEAAADTQLTGDYVHRVHKLHRLPDGGVAGGAGNWARCYTYIQWLITQQGDAPSLEDCSVLIVRPDGSHWLAEDGGTFPLIDTVSAIGCGSQAAVLAMRQGMTPAKAIESVCKADAYSSEPVQTMRVEPARKRAK